MSEIPSVEQLVAPHRSALGGEYDAYVNHVLRTLELCNVLSPSEPDVDTQLAWTVAGAFHDLGIWTHDTWDYLEPSLGLARDWLVANDRLYLEPLVARLVREHHALSSRGPSDDPVEIFRRADVIEVWLGLRRYGVPLATYRALLKQHPERRFHLLLIREFFRNLVQHPLKPLPMFRR